MFLSVERKEEIKRAIMGNFDKVMVCDIVEVLEELSQDVRVKARKAAVLAPAQNKEKPPCIMFESCRNPRKDSKCIQGGPNSQCWI